MENKSPEAITADKCVVKTILKPGQGRAPSLHARCLVHYVGKVVQSGNVFMDTRSEGEPATIVAARDSVLQGAGLNLAVAKMRVGELARVDVEPDYGYGPEGSFSFPSVPPNSKLTYEVELIGFDDVKETQGSSGMLFEDRLETAERRRRDGNSLFQAGSFVDALGKYAMALSYMDQDFMYQLQGPHEQLANAVRVPVLLNMAACHLHLQDYQGAIDVTSQVLMTDGKNVKALFRRGKARRLCGQTDGARTDLNAAMKLSPKDSAILKEAQLLQKEAKEEQQATDNMFRGRFPQPKKRRFAEQLSFWYTIWTSIKEWLSRLLKGRPYKAHEA